MQRWLRANGVQRPRRRIGNKRRRRTANEDWFNVANAVEERAVELDSPGNVADEVEKRAVELDSPGDVTDDVEEQTDSASWSLMRKTS